MNDAPSPSWSLWISSQRLLSHSQSCSQIRRESAGDLVAVLVAVRRGPSCIIVQLNAIGAIE
jgi:hypothetical protein